MLVNNENMSPYGPIQWCFPIDKLSNYLHHGQPLVLPNSPLWIVQWGQTMCRKIWYPHKEKKRKGSDAVTFMQSPR